MGLGACSSSAAAAPTLSTITVRAADGATSDAIVATCDATPPSLVVTILPAMGVPARFYAPLAEALARPEIGVVVGELRGCGTSSVRARRGVDFGYREHLVTDLPALFSCVRARFEGARMALVGHSLGGHLAAMYAGANPGTIERIALLACGTSFYPSWEGSRKLAMLAMAALARVVSTTIGHFPGRRFGFAGREARRFMHEWADLTTKGRFIVRGTDVDYDAGLANVALPILAVSFDGDVFSPVAAADHLLGKMPRAVITRRHVLADEIGARSLDHFRWAKHPEPIAGLLAPWLLGVEQSRGACGPW